jgi:hypothetical protein
VVARDELLKKVNVVLLYVDEFAVELRRVVPIRTEERQSGHQSQQMRRASSFSNPGEKSEHTFTEIFRITKGTQASLVDNRAVECSYALKFVIKFVICS